MSSLLYIVRKSMKNTLKEMLHKPAKLILWILVIAALVLVAFSSLFIETNVEETMPLFWLSGIVFLYTSLFVVLLFQQGLSNGNAIFEMNDVNLTFVAPVNPRKILLYGVVRMTKTAFGSTFFILFQAYTFSNFGVDYSGVLLIFTGFLLSVIVMMIMSLLIYSVTNGNVLRKRIARMLCFAIFVPLMVFFVASYLDTQDITASIQAAVKSPYLTYIPVSGWMTCGIMAILEGEILTGCIFLGLILSLGIGMTTYILLSNPDYFEDVLVATESVYERKRALAEGNIGAATQSNKAVKITKTGIFGDGASALFGKHMRESFRESRFGILKVSSVVMTAVAVIMAHSANDLDLVLYMFMWFQIMLIGTGKGLKETYSHYIYMIPESSFKKLLWSNVETMAKALLESILVFGISGAVIGAAPIYIISCIVAYTMFSLLLLGVNYLSMRFTGVDVSVGVMMMIYYLAVILVMLPGVIAAVIVGVFIGGEVGITVGIMILSVWELIAGLGCLALSSDVLHNCDMSVLKPNK